VSDRLINRNFKLTVHRVADGSYFAPVATTETTTITDMRIRFSIEKHLGSEPNKADVAIYNLAQSTRAAFEKKPVQVRLDAGYDGKLSLLFSGDLRYGLSSREGADWMTKLQLADGDRAYGQARISTSYKAGTLPKDILQQMAAVLGLKASDVLLGLPILNQAIPKGLAAHGYVRDELTKFLKARGLQWSIQNNTLQVLGEDDTRTNRAFLLSSAVEGGTGIIGSPEYGPPPKKGAPPTLNVKLLLYPGILPGDLVRVQSREIDGTFRAETVKHEGDSHGDDWTTTLELKPR
jgi:hypothetical protein